MRRSGFTSLHSTPLHSTVVVMSTDTSNNTSLPSGTAAPVAAVTQPTAPTDPLTQFMMEQRQINASLMSRQAELLSILASRTLPLAAVDEEKHSARDDERPTLLTDAEQRRRVRQSRETIYIDNSNSGSNVVGGGAFSSPAAFAPPVVRQPTEEERERRESHGLLFNSPDPARRPLAGTTAADEAAPNQRVPVIDKAHHSRYWQASQAISKMDKFYGDRKHDKDVDVYMFVRSIDFELDRFMDDQQSGRLELVTSCTAGPARMWLLTKMDDLRVLVARGQIRPSFAEWLYVKAEFIEKMGGGQTQRLYKAKLDALKFKRNEGSDEITKFISTFRECALRAYPLDKYPDTPARTRMLGKEFEDRVSDSDFYVWKEAMRTVPAPETLEQWEKALTAAWSMEQAVRDRQRKYPKNGGVSGRSSDSSTPSARLNNINDDSEIADGEGGETDESLNAATTAHRGDGQRSTNNKHIDGKTAKLLIAAKRCLHCYKKGHFARECKAPANRAPTTEELKA